MPEFLLELYMSRADCDALAVEATRARAAAEQQSRNGTPVRYLRSLFIPEEEICFQLYEAACADAVRDAARLAALRYEKLLEVVTEPAVG